MGKKFFLWAVMAYMVIFCGCSAKATENNLSGIHFVQAEEKLGDKTPKERAQSIKGSLRQIEGISGNAVVVEGHTAIIGLRLAEGMEKESARLTKAAEDAARAADEYIQSTSVTTNGRIVALIEEMEHGREA